MRMGIREKYVSILEDFLIPSLKLQFRDIDVIIMVDNVSYHLSRRVKNFLSENNVTQTKWPACSPGTNSIENIWYA